MTKSMLELSYTCTNEPLGAIMFGLNIQPSDKVLAVAGSGDQALAMLETARFVKAVDTEQFQIDLFKQRVQALARGDYDAVLKVDAFGSCDGYISGTYSPEIAKFMLNARNKYFLEGNRLKKIQANLGNLVIADPEDILETAQREEGFSKVYLSNVLGYNGLNDWAISETLRNIALRLPTNGLIYVSNHDSLSRRWGSEEIFCKPEDKRNNKGLYLLIKKEIEDASFLPPELCLDIDLTKQIRRVGFESGMWRPAVYRKFSSENLDSAGGAK